MTMHKMKLSPDNRHDKAEYSIHATNYFNHLKQHKANSAEQFVQRTEPSSPS